MELPSSKLGFQPDKVLIESIVSECWTGIKAMCIESANSVNKVLFIPKQLFPGYVRGDQDVEIKSEMCNLTIVPKFEPNLKTI